jgi:hypothetical protein
MKKKLTLATLFSIFLILYAYAHQPDEVCPGNVTLTTQAEVNAFNCTAVAGTLSISGNDITDLSPLSVLQIVGTGLEIHDNPNLINLDGLSSLKSVSGPGNTALKITNNPALVNVNGLSSLRDFIWTTSGHIAITDNAGLQDLTGLLTLRAPISANQSLFVDLRGNPNLDCGAFVRFFQSIGTDVVRGLYDQGKILTEENGGCTFEGILAHWWGEDCTAENVTLSSQAEVDAFYCTEVTQVLTVSGADIVDLSSLRRLKKVGELIVENNSMLTNLDGLSSLERVDGGWTRQAASLTIRNNASLQNIDALISLKYIGVIYMCNIIITGNPALRNLDGLAGVSQWEFTRFGSLEIKNNTIMEDIDGLSSLRLEGGAASFGLFVSIMNNPSLIRCSGITPLFKYLEAYELDALLKTDHVVISGNGNGCTLKDILDAEPPESCEGDMLLTSQAEVNAFSCTEVKGLLKISGDDITDLSPLSILKKVSGGLSIRDNPNLTSLDGLSALDSVKGGITIKDNALLENVDGLSSLRYFYSARNGLILSNNPSLKNLNGFSTLSHFEGPNGGRILIADNAVLESIHGLASLRAHPAAGAAYDISIIRNIQLMECGALFPFLQALGQEVIDRSNIQVLYNGGGCTLESFLFGFPYNEVCLGNITLSSQAEVDAFYCPEVEGILTITGENITDLSPLSRLRRVGAGLIIENNPNLTNLDGLSALDSINGEGQSRHIAKLVIRNNASLVDIDGLSSLSVLDANSFTDLIITDNPLLQNLNGLSSFSIFNYGKGGTINISNNAALADINGLSALSLAGLSLPNLLSVKISNNPLLTPCTGLFPFLTTLDEEVFFELISVGQIQILNNGDGCDLEDIVANGKQFIANFTLFDVALNVKVTENFYDSITLDMASVDFINWTIQANSYPEEVGSVQFIIDEKVKFTDNRFPYRLSRFIIPLLKPGMHTIRTEVYSKSNGRGKKGLGRTAVITIINSAVISNFEVVDAAGNFLMELHNGDKINILDPAFASFSIRANTVPAPVYGVKFWLNQKFYCLDKTYPYSIKGEKDGSYNPWKPRVGDYTLRATPYSRTLLKKYAGQSLEIKFQVVSENIGPENERIVDDNIANQQMDERSAEELSVTLYPIPVSNELHVSLNYSQDSEVIIVIRNIHGQPVYSQRYRSSQLNSSSLDTSGLKAGVYLLHVLGNNRFSKVLKFIKQ